MKQTLYRLVAALASFSAFLPASAQTCASGRFINDVFANVTQTADLVFGYNTVTDYSFNLNIPHQQTLKLDFYEPAGDAAAKRPLIILAFGGGFIEGTRADLDTVARALAKKGYAVASVDYRLIYNSIFNQITVASSQALVIDELVKASADMRAAIRFFKHDAATTNVYRIDTTKIIVGGVSAGAITALLTAYLDGTAELAGRPLSAVVSQAYANNGGLEGNTDLAGPNSLLGKHISTDIAGVLNIAGGIIDTTLIDASDPPLYSAQGTADEVVPYNFAALQLGPFTLPLSVYGSRFITERASHVGLYNQLFAITGGDHASPGLPANLARIMVEGPAFLQPLVCGSASPLPVVLLSFTVRSQQCAAVLHWQTASNAESSHFSIETSTDGVHFSNVANVRSSGAANNAAYTYTVENAAGTAWFRLKLVNKDNSFTYSPAQHFTSPCTPSLQVFPNPAYTRATLSGLQSGMVVSIIDAGGKLIWSQKAGGNLLNLPMAGLPKGLLLIQVNNANGTHHRNIKLLKN